MAVTLRYFTEYGKPALHKTICGGIYARVYCIFSACTMSSQRKFTFTISSPDEFLVFTSVLVHVSVSTRAKQTLKNCWSHNDVIAVNMCCGKHWSNYRIHHNAHSAEVITVHQHLTLTLTFDLESDMYLRTFLPRCVECRRGLAMRILSVSLSVCLSVCQKRASWQNRRKICRDFFYIRKIIV